MLYEPCLIEKTWKTQKMCCHEWLGGWVGGRRRVQFTLTLLPAQKASMTCWRSRLGRSKIRLIGESEREIERTEDRTVYMAVVWLFKRVACVGNVGHHHGFRQILTHQIGLVDLSLMPPSHSCVDVCVCAYSKYLCFVHKIIRLR